MKFQRHVAKKWFQTGTWGFSAPSSEGTIMCSWSPLDDVGVFFLSFLSIVVVLYLFR